MFALNPVFRDFVTGSKCGRATFFYCRVCKRDVKMRSHVSAEFGRHFGSKGHWARDVRYRVHMELPVYNKLMEPMELSPSQEAEYRARPFVDLGEVFPFPEDLLPKHSKVDSKVPFMTLVSGFCDFLRGGGDFSLLRRLWGYFLASLGKQEPLFTLGWNRSETVVSPNFIKLVVFLVVFLWLGGLFDGSLICVVLVCLILFVLFLVNTVSRDCSASVSSNSQWGYFILGVQRGVRERC